MPTREKGRTTPARSGPSPTTSSRTREQHKGDRRADEYGRPVSELPCTRTPATRSPGQTTSNIDTTRPERRDLVSWAAPAASASLEVGVATDSGPHGRSSRAPHSTPGSTGRGNHDGLSQA